MDRTQSILLLRVRYSETDQMGTFYNSRVLEWFECARTEAIRETGIPYAEMERRGIMLPIIEAHVHYLGRARYDDNLRIATTAAMDGRARVKFVNRITNADTGAGIAEGYTIHAVVDLSGRPIRPPTWFVEAMGGEPSKGEG
jgi:acyl-CoA thioester hydrolase